MKYIVSLLFLFSFFILNSFVLGQTNDKGAKNTVFYESDGTWRVSKSLIPGWTTQYFDDSAWNLSKGYSVGLCGNQTQENQLGVYPMWVNNPVEKETVYFRKKIYLDFEPQEGEIQTIFDDDGEIYVNEHLVRKDVSGTVDPYPFQDNIFQYLHKGDNIIAIKVTDSFGICQSAAVLLKITGYIETYTELDVPLFKQIDPEWSSDIYSSGGKNKLTCGKTIADCGCVISSLAMVMKYHGVNKDPYGNPTSPASLNRYFKENEKCFNEGCISRGFAYGSVVWPAVNIYSLEAHNKYQTQKIIWNGLSTYDSKVVKDDIKNFQPVILKASDREHWFVAKGEQPQTFSLNDPYFNIQILGDPLYKNTATKMSRFKKTNSDFSMIYVVSSYPDNILITDYKGRKTGYDPESNKILKEIPQSDYFFESNPNLFNTSSQKGVNIAVLSFPESGQYTISKISSAKNSKHLAVYAYSTIGNTTMIPVNAEKPVTVNYDKNAEDAVIYKNVNIEANPQERRKQFFCKERNVNIALSIVSSKDFDIENIDVKTIRLEGEKAHHIQYKDINKDKKRDLILNFDIKNPRKICENNNIFLYGKSKDGFVIKGRKKIIWYN